MTITLWYMDKAKIIEYDKGLATVMVLIHTWLTQLDEICHIESSFQTIANGYVYIYCGTQSDKDIFLKLFNVT